ncbi:hypothetical protein HYX08_03995 [Candidatus Woesearchaeota archaeon]|nr:hypothetical protein [Candidatus Woesearchaeota archaeon]
MNKKGFEVQFNWLFVLVAGAAILLFFTVVVAKQKSVSETSTKAAVLKSIEAIITGAGISSDTINTVNIPESDIDVGCGRISIGGVSKQYQSLILFAPGSIRGSRITTQTLSFNAPYRATNLLYATSTGARYIIIGNTNLAREINKTLPAELNKEFYQTAAPIVNANNYKVRIVAFEEMIPLPSSLGKMRDEDVTSLRVIGDAEKGAVEFYQKNGNSWLSRGSSIYIGRNSLVAAVYSDTLEAYECSMQNAFLKLNLVTKIYAERTKKLVQSGTSSRQVQCNQFYNSALTQLNRILAAPDFNKENADIISESAKILAGENKNAQIYSCTLIY